MPNPQQMSDQNANNNGLPIALQMLLDTQIQLIKLVTQKQSNIPNKELNARMYQVLDAQTKIKKFIPQVVTTRENHQPLKGSSNRKLEENMDTSLKACKACGEIGHIAKECPDEWPHFDDYPT